MMDIVQGKKTRGVKARERGSLAGTYIAVIILAAIWLIPIIWMVLTAFRVEYNSDGTFVGTVSGSFYPDAFGFENFRRLFLNTLFLKWFGNTLFVSVCTCLLSTLFVIMTSYTMSKMRFKMRKPFMNIAMILGLFPGFMSIIAVYYILKAMGLTQSLLALILCYSAGAGLGFHIAKGFFDIIPNALLEAASIDGANNFQTFIKVIFPLSKPIIIYTVLTSFTAPWMDFIFARVILGDTNIELHTVSVGLYQMMYGGQADGSQFSVFIAGCIIVSVPIVTLFMIMQKYYVSGVTSGAVKG